MSTPSPYPSAGIKPDYGSSANALISLIQDDIADEAMQLCGLLETGDMI
jgi:hypothetical protein